MKKINLIWLATIIILFAGCSNTVNIRDTLPVNPKEMTVKLDSFSIELEEVVENTLIENGWEVFAIYDNHSTHYGDTTKYGQSNVNFLIVENMYYDIFWVGSIKIIDLRTGKNIALYKTNPFGSSEVTIANEILKIMNTIAKK